MCVTILSLALLCGCAPSERPLREPLEASSPEIPVSEPAPPAQAEPEPSCDNEITAAFPGDGADDVYYRTDVQLELAEPDAAAQIVITDGSGRQVQGASTVAGRLVTWVGEPLSPQTPYLVTLSWGCPPVELGWSTTETGSPTEVPIVDRVYELDLRQGRWVQPRGIDALLGGVIRPLLVSVTETDGLLALVAALTDGSGRQSRCEETLDLPAAAFLDPYFELDQGVLSLEVDGLLLELSELSLSGAFSPGAERIEGVRLEGLVDTRPMVELIVPDGPDDLICGLFAGLGAPCVACPGGSGSYCLEAVVDDLRLPLRPGARVEPRGAAEIAADVSCG